MWCMHQRPAVSLCIVFPTNLIFSPTKKSMPTNQSSKHSWKGKMEKANEKKREREERLKYQFDLEETIRYGVILIYKVRIYIYICFYSHIKSNITIMVCGVCVCVCEFMFIHINYIKFYFFFLSLTLPSFLSLCPIHCYLFRSYIPHIIILYVHTCF